MTFGKINNSSENDGTVTNGRGYNLNKIELGTTVTANSSGVTITDIWDKLKSKEFLFMDGFDGKFVLDSITDTTRHFTAMKILKGSSSGSLFYKIELSLTNDNLLTMTSEKGWFLDASSGTYTFSSSVIYVPDYDIAI